MKPSTGEPYRVRTSLVVYFADVVVHGAQSFGTTCEIAFQDSDRFLDDMQAIIDAVFAAPDTRQYHKNIHRSFEWAKHIVSAFDPSNYRVGV